MRTVDYNNRNRKIRNYVIILLALTAIIILLIFLFSFKNIKLPMTGYFVFSKSRGDLFDNSTKDIINEIDNINDTNISKDNNLSNDNPKNNTSLKNNTSKKNIFNNFRSGGGSGGSSSGGTSGGSSGGGGTGGDVPLKDLIKFYKFRNLRNNISFYYNGSFLNQSNIKEGRFKTILYMKNFAIADFDLNVSNDIDFDNLLADNDFSSKKSLIHSSISNIDNVSLYIPRLINDNSVVICVNASQLSQIHRGCKNDPGITQEYYLQIGDKNLEISEDSKYFIIHGITGTGGQSLIIITNAEHLDNNRLFISDQYENVKSADKNWSEYILDQEYLRLKFEKNLSSENDITIYAKSTGTSLIEVYKKNDNIKIAEFSNIGTEKYYRIFLTNLSLNYDSFDLKVIGDPVSFDYVVDPTNWSLNSKLVIWDDSDISRNHQGNMKFYANYTDLTSETTITGATCNITFGNNVSSMSYNASSKLYEFNRDFNTTGTFYYEVRCSETSYDYLFLYDYVSIDNYRAPSGANVTYITSSSSVPDSPGSSDSYSGNTTEVVLSGFSSSQSWQGYYGNVSGLIGLKDSNGKVMYNWSSLNPRGEIYSSRAYGVNFVSIQCANSSQIYLEENITNQNSSYVDSVSNTFYQKNHPRFYTGNIEFNNDTCNSTNIFDDNGMQFNKYYEVLLADSASNIVYTSIIENNQIGYNERSNDFQMIVSEDGHGNVIQTPYYFFIELY